ncbi:MAG: hypothetical protein ABI222_15445, partial [Opitutaceae bacterium]
MIWLVAPADRIMTIRVKSFAVLAMFCFTLVGCADRGVTLVDVLRSPESPPVRSIAQLAAHPSEGLLTTKDIHDAEVIKLVDDNGAVRSFEKTLAGSTKKRSWVSHPVWH